MVWNDLLPLGSIVLLKGSQPRYRLQIIGYAQVKADNLKLFDYAAVLYANGYEDKDSVILFNHRDIDKIYAVGYMTHEMHEQIEYVKSVLDDVRSGRVELMDKVSEAEERFGKVIE